MCDENPKEYRFGNEKIGGFYKPGEFEFNISDELTREEFEEMFRQRIESLHKFGREIYPFDEETKTRKEKLKPLSIRVKAHTKEFFKNNSILSAREVLELYEDFNNGSEAFINSLLEDERDLEKQLSQIQEKLHNAKLFKEKLNDLNLEIKPLSDEEKLQLLKENFKDSEIKTADSTDDIIEDIELYNTQKVVMNNDEYLEITTSNDLTPVVYCFSDDFNTESVKEYCNEKDIEYITKEESIFKDE